MDGNLIGQTVDDSSLPRGRLTEIIRYRTMAISKYCWQIHGLRPIAVIELVCLKNLQVSV